MDADPKHNDITLNLLVHFICAGTSALILSIAHIHPEYRPISLFALLPFLWRLNRANLSGSILLGVILAVCYIFVAFTGEALVASGTFLLNLLLLSLIFSIFGIAVNRVRKYIGFCPIFIAALWLPLEYILTRYSGLGSIFAFSNTDSGFVVRLASLFGLLIVSFGIVLINTIVLKFIQYVMEKASSNCDYPAIKDKDAYAAFAEIILVRSLYCSPRQRGPPLRFISKYALIRQLLK